MASARNAILVLAAAIGLPCLGCSAGDDASPGDSGLGSRDATILEGGWGSDAGVAVEAGPAADASAPDAGWAACIMGECDLQNERDCDALTTCVPSERGTSCVERTAERDVGAQCEAVGDCAMGLACFRRGEGGVCARPCCPASGDEDCGGDLRCGGTGVMVDGTESEWWQCIEPRPCDVLSPGETCEPGEGCYIVSASGDTDCRRAGGGEVGDPCGMQNDCAPGFFCGGLRSSQCIRVCSIGDAGAGVSCPSGEGSCRVYRHSPPGTGLCTLETTGAG